MSTDPDKLRDGSLAAYSAAGHDIIMLIGPWVGSIGGFVDRSGGYTGPSLSGLNCSSLTNQAEALAKRCVMPDQIIRAALARKEAFALEFLALLKANHATGFGTDWETSCASLSPHPFSSGRISATRARSPACCLPALPPRL